MRKLALFVLANSLLLGSAHAAVSGRVTTSMADGKGKVQRVENTTSWVRRSKQSKYPAFMERTMTLEPGTDGKLALSKIHTKSTRYLGGDARREVYTVRDVSNGKSFRNIAVVSGSPQNETTIMKAQTRTANGWKTSRVFKDHAERKVTVEQLR